MAQRPGVPPAQVAEWAGHSIAVLLKLYARCIGVLVKVYAECFGGQDHMANGASKTLSATPGKPGEGMPHQPEGDG